MALPGGSEASGGARNPQAMLRMAADAFKAGRHAESDALCRRILSLVPGQPNTLHLLGLVRFNLRDYNAAISHLETALESFGDSAELHLQLGNAYCEIGDADRALSSFGRALELQPVFPEVHFNRARVHEKIGRLDLAEKELRKALSQRDAYTAAVLNLGNVLKKSNRSLEALEIYNDALAKTPDVAALHNNLGNLQVECGKTQDARHSFERAVSLSPGLRDAHINLAQLLLDDGDTEQAVSHFDSAGTGYARAKAAECLLNMGRVADVKKRLLDSAGTEPNNLLLVALSAYLTATGDQRDDPFDFCRNPLDFVRVRPGLGGIDDCAGFGADLKEELRKRNQLWSPRNSSTRQGFQTPDDLFDHPNGILSELEQIIRKEIAAYKRIKSSADNRMMREWPERYRLRGWAVRLLKGGQQSSHIHPDGWLSGVAYLTMPTEVHYPAGGIEFSLAGESYPKTAVNLPVRLHPPNVGDLVLFPSSLHHRTIPFDSDVERLSIAFDVVPLRN